MRTVLAHGLGDGAELPVDPMFIAWGAGLVVLISFTAFGVLWENPRLADASRGRRLPTRLTTTVGVATFLGRIFAAGVYVITISAAFTGSRFVVLNAAPWVVLIGVVVVMPIISLLFGDVWRAVSPLRVLASAASLLGKRAGIGREREFSDWPAAVSLAAFAWFELAYHSPASPRVLAWLLVIYSAWAVIPATIYGTEWTDRADGLGWWFSAIATMSCWTKDADGARIRWPFIGAVNFTAKAGSVVAILVMLGATTFDGVSRTQFWGDIIGDRIGWGATGFRTLGLMWAIAIVIALYLGASRRTEGLLVDGRAGDNFAPTLLPIAIGYAVAHTFAALIFDGQTLLIRASDPYGEGSNWFRTADWIENTRLLAATTIAWVQIVAVVGGHVVATILAHDRAIALTDNREDAVRSQYAMVMMMIVFTAAGLLLLVDG